MGIEDLIEKAVYRIAMRLSDVETEFFNIAGERLKKIGVMTAEDAKQYLYSADALDDQLSDLVKIKRMLVGANNANIQDISELYQDIVYTIHGDIKGIKGEQTILPFSELETAANPLWRRVYADYQAMAQSTAVSADYKKIITSMVQKMSSDEKRINFHHVMRKTIQDLTDKGISTIDYKSGKKQRMDSAVRRDLMGEFTRIVQNVQQKVGEDIGADGWEISAHAHPAIDHADIQGKIFTNAEFEKLQSGEVARDIDGKSYQTYRAIGEWNCRHVAYPFLIGASVPAYSQERLYEIERENKVGIKFDGKHYTLYEAEQLQRKYETAMRYERERGNLYKAVAETDDSLRNDYHKSKARLSDLREKYKRLGAALMPKAMRMKMERSYVPKGSTGRYRAIDKR